MKPKKTEKIERRLNYLESSVSAYDISKDKNWIELRNLIVEALDEFPEPKAAVINAIEVAGV